MKVKVVPEVIVRRLASGHFVMGLGFNRMYKIRKLHSLLYEEDRDVVADQIPVSLAGVEFDGKPTNISNGILDSILADKYINICQHTALPREPWTVLNRAKTGVVLVESVSTLACV